ncbi:Phenylalanine-specific permease [Moorella thermoacetica]|uniref:Phenylalanine-specific permease n=1 Tax=Neomoorella thermoacetica TaxID=1525 RepID=A0AAC9HJJ9_NEOTH|nr:amino acid permease [Moorella thermoacetica]AOQ24261.1 Phenylalanine-specific permease [Moorella thermoacetica]TYL14668.1 Phenylalanine-specific permease [Moorella thermoacetica]
MTGGKGEQRRKNLSAFSLIFLGLGSTIGSSFFLASGMAIRAAGPAVILGYIFSGFVFYLVLVSLGHLALKYRQRESVRGYVEEALGPTGAFITGWNLWLTSLVGMVSEAVAMAIYTRFWFPWLPIWILVMAYGFLVVGINYFGVDIVDKFEGGLTVIKAGSVLAFTGVMLYIILARRIAVAATGLLPFFPNGLRGLSQAIVVTTFAYGAGALAAAVGDTRNPRRAVPLATAGMALAQALFFLLPVTALVAVTPWFLISSQSSPFVTGLEHAGIHLGGSVLNAIVLVASSSVLLGSMFTAVTMLASLARDREAPAFLIAGEGEKPVKALVVTAGVMLLVSLLAIFLPRHIYQYAVTATGYFSFVNWGAILAARLYLSLPIKNEGRLDTKGLVVAGAGLAGLTAISLLGLTMPEQRFSLLVMVASTLILLGIGILVKREKLAPEAGNREEAAGWLERLLGGPGRNPV